MNPELQLTVNGRVRVLDGLPADPTLEQVLQALAMRTDRVAVEINGELAPRAQWSEMVVHAGDRLEVVHFVGGGSSRDKGRFTFSNIVQQII